jgi:hypothetical protein
VETAAPIWISPTVMIIDWLLNGKLWRDAMHQREELKIKLFWLNWNNFSLILKFELNLFYLVWRHFDEIFYKYQDEWWTNDLIMRTLWFFAMWAVSKKIHKWSSSALLFSVSRNFHQLPNEKRKISKRIRENRNVTSEERRRRWKMIFRLVTAAATYFPIFVCAQDFKLFSKR